MKKRDRLHKAEVRRRRENPGVSRRGIDILREAVTIVIAAVVAAVILFIIGR